METPLKIFIGYDERQPVGFQVCAQSIWEHASRPVSITRLDLRTLPIKRRGLTAFTYSRFLVPYLSNFEGYSLFLDSDILVRGDVIEEFMAYAVHRDINYRIHSGVWMAFHKERPFENASVMLFDNAACRNLTPEYIDNPENRMFDFKWCGKIAQLAPEMNHLVGYDKPNPDAKIIHYTMGLPIWEETKHSEFAQEWWDTYKRCNSSVSFEELMGRSVHVPHLDKLASK